MIEYNENFQQFQNKTQNKYLITFHDEHFEPLMSGIGREIKKLISLNSRGFFIIKNGVSKISIFQYFSTDSSSKILSQNVCHKLLKIISTICLIICSTICFIFRL